MPLGNGLGLSPIFDDAMTGGGGPPPVHGPSIVEEDGTSYILMEDGTSSILLE